MDHARSLRHGGRRHGDRRHDHRNDRRHDHRSVLLRQGRQQLLVLAQVRSSPHLLGSLRAHLPHSLRSEFQVSAWAHMPGLGFIRWPYCIKLFGLSLPLIALA